MSRFSSAARSAWAARCASAPRRRSRSRRGHCRTSSRDSCSPNNCIAPGRFCAASRTTSRRVARERTMCRRVSGADRVTQPVIRTEQLGGSPLSRAAQAGQLDRWYPPRPRDLSAWKAHCRTVTDSIDPGWRDRLGPAFGARGPAAERLDAAASGRGLVVTTGQQPGLFGGPLMTLIKAVSARALADALTFSLGIPVAPVFWAATDDADFDEAARVSVALPDGARELTLDPTAPAGTPMANVAMGDDVARLRDVLRQACGSAPHPAFLEAAERVYHPGASVGDAYVAKIGRA